MPSQLTAPLVLFGLPLDRPPAVLVDGRVVPERVTVRGWVVAAGLLFLFPSENSVSINPRGCELPVERVLVERVLVDRVLG